MTGSIARDDAPEVDVVDLALIVWRSKRFVVLCMMAVGGLFAIYAFTATPLYRAEVVLVQAEPDSSEGLLGKVGDLASLAGISTPGQSKAQERVAVLRSRDLAREFIEKEGLEPQLSSVSRGGIIARTLAHVTEGKPDPRDELRFFDRQVRQVDDDKKNGIIRLGIIWKNSEVAANWANAFALLADTKLREAAHREAQQNVEYLEGELVKTNIPAMQESLSKLLESEMRNVLLTRGGVEYAFKVIDRATAPKEKYSPQRLLLVAVGLVVGLIVGIASVIMRNLVAKVRLRSIGAA